MFLPGVQTAGRLRDSIVNGLPQGTINMTLDGVNIQDNTNKTTDGFFAMVAPRLDAVEEITFTAAAQGADGTGMGATQIRFVTRSGTNKLPRQRVPHLSQRRAECEYVVQQARRPREGAAAAQSARVQRRRPGRAAGIQRTGQGVLLRELRGAARTGRHPAHPHDSEPGAQQGVFRYNTTRGVQAVNLFELAAANGQTSTPDPIIARLLTDIRNATGSEGNVRDLTDPLFQEYSFQVPTTTLSRYPTVRLDYQITSDTA